MSNDYTVTIKGHVLEYLDDTHTYIVDGEIVPSITQIVQDVLQSNSRYQLVNQAILEEAKNKGTEVHKAIEDWCKSGKESNLPEVHNFDFLRRKAYNFTVVDNEVPVILFNSQKHPVGAGRLDMVIEMNGQLGGVDIKRTSSLNREYVTLQLNLYRIAYRQTYGKNWEFIKALQLKDDIRKFVALRIDEKKTLSIIDNIGQIKAGDSYEADGYIYHITDVTLNKGVRMVHWVVKNNNETFKGIDSLRIFQKKNLKKVRN